MAEKYVLFPLYYIYYRLLVFYKNNINKPLAGFYAVSMFSSLLGMNVLTIKSLILSDKVSFLLTVILFAFFAVFLIVFLASIKKKIKRFNVELEAESRKSKKTKGLIIFLYFIATSFLFLYVLLYNGFSFGV